MLPLSLSKLTSFIRSKLLRPGQWISLAQNEIPFTEGLPISEPTSKSFLLATDDNNLHQFPIHIPTLEISVKTYPRSIDPETELENPRITDKLLVKWSGNGTDEFLLYQPEIWLFRKVTANISKKKYRDPETKEWEVGAYRVVKKRSKWTHPTTYNWMEKHLGSNLYAGQQKTKHGIVLDRQTEFKLTERNVFEEINIYPEKYFTAHNLTIIQQSDDNYKISTKTNSYPPADNSGDYELPGSININTVSGRKFKFRLGQTDNLTKRYRPQKYQYKAYFALAIVIKNPYSGTYIIGNKTPFQVANGSSENGLKFNTEGVFTSRIATENIYKISSI